MVRKVRALSAVAAPMVVSHVAQTDHSLSRDAVG
jgi:hypothetical protein